MWLALAASAAAIVLNIVPLGAWDRDHVDWFRRWTDLREELDGLILNSEEDTPTDEAIQRLKEAEAKIHRISATEPLVNKSLKDRCLEVEEISRGCSPLPNS